MNNLALNRPARISSTCRWSKFQDCLKEARLGNNGSTERSKFFHSGKEFNPWWEVDLENIYRIERVKIYNRVDRRERLKLFIMLWSLDGEEWFEIHRQEVSSPLDEIEINLHVSSAARYFRIQGIGYNYLHLREIEIFGNLCKESDADSLIATLRGQFQNRISNSQSADDRKGSYTKLGSVEVFNDEKYPERIRTSIRNGHYEERERQRVAESLRLTDRVLEIGTAVGAVAMTAASIIGAKNVITFDANPEIVQDAKRNFIYNGMEDISSYNGILKNRLHFKTGEMVDFYIAKAFWASRMFIEKNADDIIKKVSVPTYCLEDEIDKFGATVLVCDIEGGEVDLLRGAELGGIRLIIMETHYWAVGERATDDMIRYLVEAGFSLHLGMSSNHISVLRRHPEQET